MSDDHCCDVTRMCGGFIYTNSGRFKFTEEILAKKEKRQSEIKSWI